MKKTMELTRKNNTNEGDNENEDDVDFDGDEEDVDEEEDNKFDPAGESYEDKKKKKR